MLPPLHSSGIPVTSKGSLIRDAVKGTRRRTQLRRLVIRLNIVLPSFLHNGNSLRFVNLLLCAQSLWQTRRSGRDLVRVALPTVQRQHELSREGFPQYSLSPYGGIRWISLMNRTRQGNGSSSWSVREKMGGPGKKLGGPRITVKRERK